MVSLHPQGFLLKSECMSGLREALAPERPICLPSHPLQPPLVILQFGRVWVKGGWGGH